MNICVEGLSLAVISGESLLGVGDIKSSINSSFQGSEHLSSSRGAVDGGLDIPHSEKRYWLCAATGPSIKVWDLE